MKTCGGLTIKKVFPGLKRKGLTKERSRDREGAKKSRFFNITITKGGGRKKFLAGPIPQGEGRPCRAKKEKV